MSKNGFSNVILLNILAIAHALITFTKRLPKKSSQATARLEVAMFSCDEDHCTISNCSCVTCLEGHKHVTDVNIDTLIVLLDRTLLIQELLNKGTVVTGTII